MEAADNDVLQRAVAGDRDALVELLKQHGPPLRRSLAGKIPRRWQSVLSEDDVMQQTYADAARGISELDSSHIGAFVRWLGTTAERNLLDAIKALEREKRGGSRRPVELVRSDETYVALIELLTNPGTSPTGQVAREEAKTALERAIDQLPEAYARVVMMYDLEDRPAKEVAEALARSVGAVYMLRARAHDLLRNIMGRTSRFFTN